jgi:hypothetical protein
LAEETTIQGLAVSLEQSTGTSVLVHGIGDSGRSNNILMFIACQADGRTLERKALPQNIATRLRVFASHRPDFEALVANCKDIAVSDLRSSHAGLEINPVILKQMAAFIDDLNQRKLPSPAVCSILDVRKLFRRLGTMQLDAQN